MTTPDASDRVTALRRNLGPTGIWSTVPAVGCDFATVGPAAPRELAATRPAMIPSFVKMCLKQEPPLRQASTVGGSTNQLEQHDDLFGKW